MELIAPVQTLLENGIVTAITVLFFTLIIIGYKQINSNQKEQNKELGEAKKEIKNQTQTILTIQQNSLKQEMETNLTLNNIIKNNTTAMENLNKSITINNNTLEGLKADIDIIKNNII